MQHSLHPCNSLIFQCLLTVKLSSLLTSSRQIAYGYQKKALPSCFFFSGDLSSNQPCKKMLENHMGFQVFLLKYFEISCQFRRLITSVKTELNGRGEVSIKGLFLNIRKLIFDVFMKYNMCGFYSIIFCCS